MKKQVFDGNKLKSKRTKIGFSINRLAKKSGISRQTISSWEKNTQIPQDKQLAKVIKHLGCKKSDLYGTLVNEENALGRHFAPFYTSNNFTLYQGDALAVLTQLDSDSVDCVFTSPPYYGQRDYGIEEQIGLESHPQDFINKLIVIFRETKRTLKPTGSLWVNLGDTYWSGKGKSHGIDNKQKNRRFERPQDRTGVCPWCVPKQRMLIPHRFAIAMQDEGWIVRNDNVWYKTSPMPDPVSDRCAITHEYVFHFVQKRHYFFDAAAVAVPSNGNKETKPPPSVWELSTSQSTKKHPAVFPKELVELPVRATLPPKGTFLDPFCGSGTALNVAVAQFSSCRAIGIDISKNALKEARKLLETTGTFEQDEV